MAKELNKKLFLEAKKYLVGGVNSPIRSFRAVGGEPIFIKRAQGSKIYSEDGRQFIDYCQGFGALILGHSYPAVVRELNGAIQNGTSFGAPTVLETELARIISGAIPSIERIRLTNSGTEAVMGAIRLARAFTGRNKIIKFKGAYHGATDYLLDCQNTLLAPYNGIEKVKALFKRHKKALAAVIVEPVAGNSGVILPEKGFLGELRRITQENKSILIFDEVITGFRLTFGGAQNLFQVNPDLTCLGKIIGGGLPVGAFGGRYEIMRLLAPEGKVYQAGTFSGNPLTVSAGLATLKVLSRANPYARLGMNTDGLCENVISLAKKYRIKLNVNSIGSMFSVSFTKDPNLFKGFYRRLLQEGVYFSPSHLETNFLSGAHSQKDIEYTLKAIDKIFTPPRRWRKGR